MSEVSHLEDILHVVKDKVESKTKILTICYGKFFSTTFPNNSCLIQNDNEFVHWSRIVHDFMAVIGQKSFSTKIFHHYRYIYYMKNMIL
jgi:hypothetical protein